MNILNNIHPYVVVNDQEIASGEPRSPGVGIGVYAEIRSMVDECRAHGQPYVFKCESATTEDFLRIKEAEAFICESPAQTAFGPVQAVSMGVPTIINCQGLDNVTKGSVISVCATKGRIFGGKRPVQESSVSKFYRLSWELIKHSVETGQVLNLNDAMNSFEQLVRSNDIGRLLIDTVDEQVQEFWSTITEIRKTTSPKIWLTTNSTEEITRARLSTSMFSLVDGELKCQDGKLNLGLIRDERIWANEKDLDILRSMIFISPTDRNYAHVRQIYVNRLSELLQPLFSLANGETVVLRTLCMPLSMLFDFDRDAKYLEQIMGRHIDKSEFEKFHEHEKYSGNRGMRLFTQRPDYADAWLEGALRAWEKAVEQQPNNQTNPRLRLLLPTITLPEEARRFIAILENKIASQEFNILIESIDGISIMMETTGAYLLLNDFFHVRGKHLGIDGVMVGSNDFTATVFSVNREDSTKNIWPGYQLQGVVDESPFSTLNKELVGRAISEVIRISKEHRAIVGIGGELAGETRTLEWLTTTDIDYATTARSSLWQALAATSISTNMNNTKES